MLNAVQKLRLQRTRELSLPGEADNSQGNLHEHDEDDGGEVDDEEELTLKPGAAAAAEGGEEGEATDG